MKFVLLVLGAAFTFCLALVLAILFVLQQPVPVINYLAAHWLGIPLSLSQLEYRWEGGRLLCHVQGIEYVHSLPPLGVDIADFAFDVDLSQLGQRRIVINELALGGASITVEQQGMVPWWQQFSSASADHDEEGTPFNWYIDVRTVQMQDVSLRMNLPEQQRQFDLLLSDFSSGRSSQDKRWLQLRGDFDGYPLRIDGEALGIRDIIERREAFDVDLDLSIGDAFLEAHGRLDPFYRRGATDLQLDLDVASLPKLLAGFGLQLPAFHSASATARLTDSAADFQLEDIDIALATDNARLLVSGSVAEPLQHWLPQLSVSARIDSMKTFLAQLDVELPLDFYAQAEGQLVRHNGFLELRAASGGVAFQGFEIAGAHQFGIREATVRLPKDEISGWDGSFELPLDVLGGIVTAGLILEGESLFYELPVDEVSMLIRTDGMDLGGRASYKNLPIGVTFAMDEDWEKLHGQLKTPGAKFSVSSNLDLPYLPFNFEVNTEDLLVINNWLRLEFPQATAVEAHGELRLANDNAVSLHKFSTRVENSGELAVQIPLYDFESAPLLELEAKFAVASTGQFAPLADAAIDYINTDGWRYTLQALSTSAEEIPSKDQQYLSFEVESQIAQEGWLEGALKGDLALRYQEGALDVESLAIDFAGTQLTLQTSGHVSRRGKLPNVELDISARLAANGLFNLPNAASLSGRILSENDAIYTESLQLRGGNSRVRLDARLTNPFDGRPRLVASIGSDYLQLTEFLRSDEVDPAGSLAELEEEQKTQSVETQSVDGEQQESGEAQFFSAEPWDLAFLDAFDAMVTVRMEHLQFSNFKLEQLQADIALNKGELTILPLKLVALDGTVVSAFTRGLEGDTNVWQLNLTMDGVDAAGFDSGSEKSNQGVFSARVNLDSEGNSPHEFMSHLSGRITEKAEDMILYGVDLDTLAPDFLRRTINLINPFSSKEDEVVKTHLECQIGHVLLGDGLLNMDRSMLIRTPSSTFVVSWFVDFATEQQRLQLIPRLRRGLGLSTTDIARTVQVTGTLLDPRLVLDPEGLFLVGAGSAALYVTGGWLVYFTWRQIERNMKKPDACENAAEEYMGLSRSELKLPEREGTLSEQSAQPPSNRSARGRRTR